MNEEQKKILRMLEEGKITADEAERLLKAVEPGNEEVDSVKTTTIIEDRGVKGKGKAKWLKVRVYEQDLDKPKVNVRIPLSLLKIGAKLGAKLNVAIPGKAHDVLQEKGINLENLEDLAAVGELVDTLSEEAPFELVNVEDNEKRERVIVVIE
ncbi:hypothetical protein JXI42_13655 [bacterium]|nr:hypothetical protein [bacterium]